MGEQGVKLTMTAGLANGEIGTNFEREVCHDIITRIRADQAIAAEINFSGMRNRIDKTATG
jgi:dihydroxyacetone kinase DhaKLM complex PTS-EIIA-like component DhaM